MSNDVMNLLSVESDDTELVCKLVDFVTNDEGFFSLDAIKPYPRDFSGFSIGTPSVCQAKIELEDELGVVVLSDLERLFSAPPAEHVDRKDVERAKSLFKKHGACDFVDWACAHWGTRCIVEDEAEFEGGGFCFVSVNSTILPILKLVSAKFPGVELFLKYADEDYGSNCGYAAFKNGSIVEQKSAPAWFDQALKERHFWHKFACDVWNCPDYHDEWLTGCA